MRKVPYVLLGAVGVLMLAQTGEAVLMSNGGTTLFYDDFETASDPSPYSWNEQQADSVPRTDSDPDGASPGKNIVFADFHVDGIICDQGTRGQTWTLVVPKE